MTQETGENLQGPLHEIVKKSKRVKDTVDKILDESEEGSSLELRKAAAQIKTIVRDARKNLPR